MLQRLGFSGFLAVALTATGALSASAAGKVPADVNVTVTIDDSGPLTGVGYRIASDVHSPNEYKASATTKVTTRISSNMLGSFWILTTYYTSKGQSFLPGDRSVWFDLTEPELVGQPVPPITGDYVQVQLVANCYKDGVDLLTMTIGGGAKECRGSFRFQTTDGRAFRLAFQPQNYAETDRMKVTCTQNLTATTCNAWTISPIGNRVTSADANPKSLVRLVQIDPSSEAILNDQLGNYYVSFFINVTR